MSNHEASKSPDLSESKLSLAESLKVLSRFPIDEVLTMILLLNGFNATTTFTEPAVSQESLDEAIGDQLEGLTGKPFEHVVLAIHKLPDGGFTLRGYLNDRINSNE